MSVDDGDITRISVRQSMGSGQDHVNVYHVQWILTGSITNETAMTAAATWIDTAMAQFEDYLDDDLVPLDMKVDKVQYIGDSWDITENVGVSSWASAYTPSSTGDPLPAGVAALVLLRTAIGKVFGRKFFGGLTEPFVSKDTLTSNLLTALASLVTYFVDQWDYSVDIGIQAGVASLREAAFQAFNEIDIPTPIGYQRRRRPGAGS
jgi:hypothetical protein